MKRFIFNKNNLINNQFKIDGNEFNHLKNVMRIKVDDLITAVCFDEFDYISKVIEIGKNYAICEVLNKEKNIANPSKNVVIYQALLRNENLSVCVQKLTELGCQGFIPFQSEFCTAKKTDTKHKKLQEISNQSIKQCGRSKPLEVGETLFFNEMLKQLEKYDLVVFANESENNKMLSEIEFSNKNNIAIIVGCEGGFSPKEKDLLSLLNNVVSVSLGKRILRAETACLAISALVLNKIGEI